MMHTHLGDMRKYPCPFCRAAFNSRNFTPVPFGSRGRTRYRVWCDKCDKTGVNFGDHQTITGGPYLKKIRLVCKLFQWVVITELY